MMEVQHRDGCQRKTGFFFTMASLCSDRISHLPIAPASDDNRFVVLLHISTTVRYKVSKCAKVESENLGLPLKRYIISWIIFAMTERLQKFLYFFDLNKPYPVDTVSDGFYDF